jgi:hypothetical protein
MVKVTNLEIVKALILLPSWAKIRAFFVTLNEFLTSTMQSLIFLEDQIVDTSLKHYSLFMGK